MEGSMLSVSKHPEVWAEIAALGNHAQLLERIDGSLGRFVDYYSLSQSYIDRILASSGLVKRTSLWKATSTDEDGGETYILFASKREAENEDDAEITKVSGWKPTPILKEMWHRYFDSALHPIMVPEIAMIFILEKSKKYDGIWWDEELAPYRYSAPRGGIFQNRLPEWQIVKEKKI